MRKTLRITGWSFGGGILLSLGAFVGLLVFPGFLFAHKTEYRNFTVYSQQQLVGMDSILRNVESRLKTSPLYDPSLEQDIFFGHDNVIFRDIQRVRAELIYRAMERRPSPTYNASWPPYFSHIVTFRVPDVQHNRLLTSEWPNSTDMTYTLTHEVAHSLVFARLGISAVARLPMWKQEGYPDYVAAAEIRANPHYTVRASVERMLRVDLSWLKDEHGKFTPLRYDCIGKSFLRIENGDYWHTCYYISRVLMEYLLDVKGLKFDQVMSPAISDTDTLNELMAAYNAGGPGGNSNERR